MDLHENLVDSAQERLRSAYPDVKALGIACDVTKPEELSTALSNIERIFQIAKLAQFLPTQAPCSTKRFSRATSGSGQLPFTLMCSAWSTPSKQFYRRCKTAKPAQFFAPQPRWADWFGATAAQHPTRPANMPLYHSLNPCPLKSQADHRK